MLKFGVLVFLYAALVAVTFAHSGHQNALDYFKGGNIQVEFVKKIQMSVSPNLLNDTGKWVTVSFGGISNPNNTDLIAVYSPSNVNFTATSPIKFQYANFSSTYLETGNGQIRFNLINMYADYIFAFYRNGTEYPILTAISNTVSFTNTFQPLQQHISLTGDTSEMRVSWASGTESVQYVKWGTESGNYPNELQSTSYTYTANDLCGAPATTYGWRNPGNLQTAIINNIEFNTTIYYILGSSVTGWTKEASFQAPKPVGANYGVKLVTYGDMGKGEIDQSTDHWEEVPSMNTTKNTYERIMNGYELVVHIGDIAYAVGYSSEWDEFLAQILPVASRVPYMTLPGNHERDFTNSGAFYNVTDSGGECGIPYELRFQMPGTTHEEPWYSFEYGNIHFVMMSTEVNYSIGSPQYDFIKNDLQNVDRSLTPWVIFAGHRPMYIDSDNNATVYGDQTVAVLLRKNLELLLVKYEVDLAIWGHHHSYQRTCPVYNEVCYYGQQYPIHCVIGMAGMGLSAISEFPPQYMEYADASEYGYSVIETTATQLHMSYYNNDNILRDDFVINKNQS